MSWRAPWTPGLPVARCVGHVFPPSESPARPAEANWPRVPARTPDEWTLGPLVIASTLDSEGRCRGCRERGKEAGPVHRDVREREAARAQAAPPLVPLFDDTEPEPEREPGLAFEFRRDRRGQSTA